MLLVPIYSIFFGLVTSFAITYLGISSIILIANEKRLYDVKVDIPSHFSKILTFGGVAIFAGLIISITLLTDFSQYLPLQYLIASITLISFVGIKDDIVGLSPFKKAVGQIVAATILVVWGDIRITDFFGIFGIQELSYIFSILFSIFTIFIIINSFNLIDGIDGLASTLGLMVSLTFGIYFFMVKEYTQNSIIAASLIGSLLAFLRYNVPPAKIFMGDTGSMIIGLIISFLTIEFIQVNKLTVNLYHIHSAPVVAIGILIVPLFDLLRVFILRIYHKRPPFSPDKNHLHHLLLKIGHTHNYVTFIIASFSLFVIVLCFILENLGNYRLGTIILGLIMIFTYTIYYFSRKVKINE